MKDVAPSAPSRPSRPGRSGFTLVEILLAIAISTLIMVAATTFVFSVFTLLAVTQNDPGLEHHKLGVASFLQYAFSQAGPPAANTGGTPGSAGSMTSLVPPGGAGGAGGTGGIGGAGNTTGGNTTDASGGAAGGLPAPAVRLPGATNPSASTQSNRVTWGHPPGSASLDDPYLSFRLDDDNPLLVWEDGPRPPITCWLYFKSGEGLSIVWQTDQQKQLDPTALQRTILSPLVTKLTFYYYDPSTQVWTNSDLPQKDATSGTQLLPDFVRLTFKLDGKEETMSVRLPNSQTNQLLY